MFNIKLHRAGWIRTHDLLNPVRAFYHAELRAAEATTVAVSGTVRQMASGHRSSFPREYEATIQVSLRRFQKCSSVWAAGSGSQSPTIWLRRNRNRGGRVGPGNKATQLICVILRR